MSDNTADPARRTIRQLDEETIEQIAAGEVVERPASAVKELVENSLDAQATTIDVHVRGGGADHLHVRDDGIGMSKSELRLAIKPHTTSKLRTLDDLHRGIQSYGFRGEALHAIGTVAKLTITSKPRDEDTRGHQIEIRGGTVGAVTPAGCPPGTSVEVRDLFFNTPARREFLSAETTEFDHINRIVSHYALANPDVAFTLHHDDREVFRTPGRGNALEAILAVYNRDVADAMIPIDRQFDSGPVTHVGGHVSDPEVARSRPKYLSTFVNDRFVNAPAIKDGILAAYDRQLAPDRYPFAVIECEVDNQSVDVNVHPRKLEVRFENENAVSTSVKAAVSAALSSAGIIRSTAPRGPGKPAETELDNSAVSNERPVTRGASVPSSDPFEQDTKEDTPPPASESSSRLATPQPDSRRFRGPINQESLSDAENNTSFDRLPQLTVFGQLRDTFIVAESPDGLILIDQHAADERIAYERLRNQLQENPTTQQLVQPVRVDLTRDEVNSYEHVVDALDSIGFETAMQEDVLLEVAAVPAVFDRSVPPSSVRDAIHAAVTAADPNEPISAIASEILADLACDPAVTGNTRLADGAIVNLLKALDACDEPFACPHGRPTLICIDADELAERFERTYPGHADRRF